MRTNKNVAKSHGIGCATYMWINFNFIALLYTNITLCRRNVIYITAVGLIFFLKFYLNIRNYYSKIIMIGDDSTLHDFHSITATACDLVLISDPLAVLKYKENFSNTRNGLFYSTIWNLYGEGRFVNGGEFYSSSRI